ncbi:DUF805 domain-containing protein [Sphingomonas sp. BN140010]|uniref:DUF805 domain-containing protein n=1 Tax=Sphingomonas arvum TaxID=2992113 RepID=A0ABT3JEF1_9SPHN|nr:DUF805 domain-containing protein [Sphingomonas sp. BN140010]MCW3797299.1 DUF805 domain-containing protein [Sphingomonas sp. BN140010]
MDYALAPLRRYAQFSGRARRAEYWWYTLALVIASVVTSVLDNLLGWGGVVGGAYGPLTGLLVLSTLIPSLAVSVRRLHDTNRSGFWLLLFMAPYLVMAVMAGMALAQGNAAGALASVGLLGLVVLILGVVIFVFLVLDGTKGDNRFGPDPKAAERTGAYHA